MAKMSTAWGSRRFPKVAKEPEYLDSDVPEIPTYDELNVQLKSYDFTLLENYSSFVHKAAENLGIKVEECWATPCKSLEVQTFKPQSTILQDKYFLNVYERNVQVIDVPAPLAPIFFEVVHTALPEGVELSIHEHQPEYEEVRYIPDLELKELKARLESMADPNKPKK
nr:EOG090X0MUO [Eulimnadia texana]